MPVCGLAAFAARREVDAAEQQHEARRLQWRERFAEDEPSQRGATDRLAERDDGDEHNNVGQ